MPSSGNAAHRKGWEHKLHNRAECCMYRAHAAQNTHTHQHFHVSTLPEGHLIWCRWVRSAGTTHTSTAGYCWYGMAYKWSFAFFPFCKLN